ncbi:MAG: hypothetical protein OXB95_13015 [Rhodobacteraceae bacterium]|nr:hypothetical protein [Paracoccaceae bacterium]
MAEPTSAPITPTIANHEKLGRHEWYKSAARKVLGRLERGEPHRMEVRKFMPPKDNCELSVDRMDHCDRRTLADMAEKNTTLTNRSLRGWHTLSAGEVAEVNCAVQSSPFPGNPYHADIVIQVNLGSADSRDDQREFVRDLAYRAVFEPR